MAELLLIRQAILLEYDITVQTRWLSSEENRQADQISRDAVGEFVTEAHQMNIPLGQGLDLRHAGLIEDLPWLFARMLSLTAKGEAL